MQNDMNDSRTKAHESTEGVPATHTSLPWHFSRKFRYVSDINHRVIAEISPLHGFQANAALIVRAVNSHNALVDVLSRWLAYAEEELSEFDLEDCQSEDLCHSCQSAGCINLRIRETRAALTALTAAKETP